MQLMAVLCIFVPADTLLAANGLLQTIHICLVLSKYQDHDGLVVDVMGNSMFYSAQKTSRVPAVTAASWSLHIFQVQGEQLIAVRQGRTAAMNQHALCNTTGMYDLNPLQQGYQKHLWILTPTPEMFELYTYKAGHGIGDSHHL